ncbi:MAG TPA: peptidoglycan DD-metalloendopeptidase family protein [Candidatus Wallbacteria bacterium]|nr:peptidoglycan DD-metalloendopeptidase family protein [Candidatus Wallbacteria bacterium]
MNTLKKLFAYLLIVLFISIFFQSIVILFIKYSKEETGLTLTHKFQNSFLNMQGGEKSSAKGANHLLKTLSNVVTTLSSNDQAVPEKMVVSVQRSSQIEEYRPQVEVSSPFGEEKIELKPLKITAERSSDSAAAAKTQIGNASEVIDIPYGKKIIFHTLSRGEKLSDLAKLYSVPLDTIKKLNGFSDSYRLYIGQKIMIVQTSGDAQQAKATARNEKTQEQNVNAANLNSEGDPGNIDSILKSSRSAKNASAKINGAAAPAPAKDAKKAGSKLSPASSKEADPLSDIIKSAKNKRRVFKWPVRGVVTSKFGMRIHPVYGNSSMHTGVDIGAGKGRAIKPAMGGTVLFAGWLGGYGKMVEIRHPKGYTTRYAHMSSIKVKKGQTVNSSTTIGNVGDTGTSTGYHLHFEVRKYGRPLNPLAFIRN